MNKVFIPDNEGGGTWEAWKDDRPNYKAHAEALAEALREFVRVMEHPKTTAAMPHTVAKAREALANWEGVRK